MKRQRKWTCIHSHVCSGTRSAMQIPSAHKSHPSRAKLETGTEAVASMALEGFDRAASIL